MFRTFAGRLFSGVLAGSIAAAGSLMGPAPASAVVVAEYSFFVSETSSPAVTTQTPSPSLDTHAGTVASDAAWGSSAGFFTSAQHVGGTTALVVNKAVITTVTTPSSLEAALAQDIYLGFSVTNNTGAPLPLAELTFDHGFANANPGITASLAVFARIGGGTFTLDDRIGQTLTVNFPGVTDNEDIDFGQRIFDMSSLVVPNASSVEVRLYFFDTSTTGHRGQVIDNLTLTAVPEPTGSLVTGIVAFGLMARRRLPAR